MAQDVNVVALLGRLTKDPELAGSANTICKLRLAVTSRRKVSEEWVDQSNYFDVTVFGNQGASCAEHLIKGQQVAITGRLSFREWEGDGGKRSAVEIIAEQVQFLAKPRETAEASA